MAVAVVAGLASTAGAYGTAVALSATFSLAWAGTAFAIGAGLSMISQALQPSLRVGQDTGLSTSVANPIAERPIIYGRTRTGGTIVYFTTSGADNKYLHLVIAVAGHAIDGYEKVYFDDEVIWEDGSYVDDWVQNAQINFYDGTQTTADQDLINASNEWNSNCILNDTAYIHVRLEYDPEVYTNGIPSITTTIRGKKVLDPRTDVTAWSENPALCIYDYLKDPKYGLNDDTVNEAQVIASANVCDQLVTIDTGVDQTRYALSGFISTGDTIKANLEKMLSSMFGKLVCSGGELFVNAGYYTSPVLDIDESLLVGAVSLQTKTSRRNVYNAVKGTFLSEEENYIFADYPSIKSDTYSTEDGEPLYLDLPLPCTTNNVRAQRLAKLSLNKSRQQRTLSIPVNLAGLKVRAGDVIRFTSERLGISNAEYEVIDFEFEYSDQLIVNLVCVETGASLYDWTVADKLDFSVGSDITIYDGSAVAPTGLTATAVSDILSDGTDSTYIDVAWTNPSDIYFDYVVLKYGDQSIVTKDQTYRINNVDENTEYTITISAYNTFGRQSTGLSTNVTTVRDTTAPANITSITATGGLQTIDLSWTNPTDDDFDLVRIKVASTNSEPTGYSYEVRADNFIDDVGAYSATRYYWLAPVDRTGNVGNYVSGGSATTGSITINDIPQVAGTFYLTLGNDDAPTGTEFYTAVGRDPVDGDFAIVNKEFAFSYNGSAWTAVTEFIDGSLLVSQSITTLGDVTAGTFSLGSGKFVVDSSGNLSATDAIISGNITADSLDVEDATITGTLTAPIGWSNSVYSGVINRGNLNESVKDLIDERIAEVTGGISGDFGQDDGYFSYIAQGNPDPVDPTVSNITHESGKNLTIELSGSRSWNRQFIGLPDTDMGVRILIERSPAGADTWTTIETLTDVGDFITTTGPDLVHTGTYAYSISIYRVITDDPASGNYDYRAGTTDAGSAYSVGVPIQLTVVEPATAGAGNADTLDNEDGTYYLDYNNFTNTPTFTTFTEKNQNEDITGYWDFRVGSSSLKVASFSSSVGYGYIKIGGATGYNSGIVFSEGDVNLQSDDRMAIRYHESGDRVEFYCYNDKFGNPVNARSAFIDKNGSGYFEGNVFGGTYYDRDSTAYYVDPASTSHLQNVDIVNDLTVGVEINTGDLVVQDDAIIDGNLTVNGTITGNVSINGYLPLTGGAIVASPETNISWASGANWSNGWLKIGNSSSGWSIDNNEIFHPTNGYLVSNSTMTVGANTQVTIASPNIEMIGNIKMGGQTVIDSSRNLTNIGTYNGYNPSSSSSAINSVISFDNRNVNDTPTSRNKGLYVDFKSQSVIGLSGSGTYAGVLTFRSYGSSTDISGGNTLQMAYDQGGKLYTRYGSGTTSWGGWGQICKLDSYGSLTLKSDTYQLNLRTNTNQAVCGISFSDNAPTVTQSGNIRYYHADSSSYGSGNAFVLSGDQATMTVLADGKLMFKEGLYLKPSSGTGAGTQIIDASRNITGANITSTGHIYGRSVNSSYSNLYRFGGIYFTWDSDSYGTNTNHSIRSTYGDSYGDHITINSYGNVRINIDSNGNGTNVFEIGRHTTGTANTMFKIDETSFVYMSGGCWADTFVSNQDTAYYIIPHGNSNISTMDFDRLDGPSTSSRDKIRVYDSSAYAIGMQSGVKYGGLNDWAMTFQMNNESDRGFWWGDTSDSVSDGAMSLTTAGHLFVKSRVDAQIFYDRDNTGYYVNPASTSNFVKLDVNTLTQNDNEFLFQGSSDDYGQGWKGTYQLFTSRYHGGDMHFSLESNSGASSYALSLIASTAVFVNLKYNGSTKLATTGSGVTVIGSLSQTSDVRLKKDIEVYTSGLNKVLQLEPKSFTWIENGDKDFGLIAQEVETVLPELVTESNNVEVEQDDNGDVVSRQETCYKSVDYIKINMLLVNAVKEQQEQIESLSKRISQLENK